MRPRAGYALLELMIALVLTCATGALLLRLLLLQQRHFRDALASRESAARVADAEAILSSELRSVSPAHDSLRLLGDSALDAFTVTGRAIACRAISPGDSVLALVPADLADGNPLSSFLHPPDGGDLASFLRADSTGGSWEPSPVLQVTSRTAASACPGSPFVTIADGGRAAFELKLGSQAAAGAGTIVRITRRGRYSLYRAADGFSWLGYRRCAPASCAAVQPVAGPLLAYRPAGPTGLRFALIDSLGDAPRTPLTTAGIRIELRSEPRNPSVAAEFRRDSTYFTIAPRGRQ